MGVWKDMLQDEKEFLVVDRAVFASLLTDCTHNVDTQHIISDYRHSTAQSIYQD